MRERGENRNKESECDRIRREAMKETERVNDLVSFSLCQ